MAEESEKERDNGGVGRGIREYGNEARKKGDKEGSGIRLGLRGACLLWGHRTIRRSINGREEWKNRGKKNIDRGIR